MKPLRLNILIIGLLLLPSINTSDFHNHRVDEIKASSTVYICTGPYSKRYHKTRPCSGLNNCSGHIKRVSLKKAQRKGRTPCGICYR